MLKSLKVCFPRQLVAASRRTIIPPFTSSFYQHIHHHSTSTASSVASDEASFRPEPQTTESFLRIGSRRIFTHDHDMYRELCRKFYKEKVIPYHSQWEKDGEVPRDIWLQAGSNGMLGVTIPEKYGGAGLDIFYAAVHWEEQMYAFATGPGFWLQSEIILPYILHYGSEEMKSKYLPPLCRGEKIIAIAMTEPGAGSDLQNIRTTARREGDSYIINGSKTFISNGWMSDCVIVCAKTDPTKGAKGISLFLVDTNTPGFVKGKKLNKLGMKAQDTAELSFEDMKVPAAALIGEENKGFIYLMSELAQERLLIADQAVALAEACYETTRSYVKERKAFGNTIASLQVTKHKLAEMKTEITIARTFLDRCIELQHEKRLDKSTVSMAKYWSTELQNKVANQCVQMHGGWGYMWEFPVARALADGRVSMIYGGANEIMKELISRDI